MDERPLRTTVIGSYPFPGWLEFASQHLDEFGADDIREMQHDATVAAVHDQVAAGPDVITDGEQSRLDFNLSFYGYLTGIDLESVIRASHRLEKIIGKTLPGQVMKSGPRDPKRAAELCGIIPGH